MDKKISALAQVIDAAVSDIRGPQQRAEIIGYWVGRLGLNSEVADSFAGHYREELERAFQLAK